MSYVKTMETTKIDVPTELLRIANPGATDFSTEVVQLFALELFREEKVSLGRAAELCHTLLATFMDFVAAHNVSPICYGLGELEEDRCTLASLGL